MAGSLDDIQRSRSPLTLPSSAYKRIGDEDKNTIEQYANVGLGVFGLFIENVASHPFQVLRRQCQVNNVSFRYHRTPFTVLPVIVGLNRSQGLGRWPFKGLGSSLVIKGLGLGVEDFASKLTPWPKEIDAHSSCRAIGQHLLLKGVAAAVVTPFFSASLVETVQSEIASEKPGILDVFKEGLRRLLASFTSSASPHGRMLPFWTLIPANVAYGLLHYVTFTITSGLARTVINKRKRNFKLSEYGNQMATLFGRFVADVLLYPMETILHRLHLQGTRAIIDNLDTGREVMPIMTRYEGFFDCLTTIRQEEGIQGLFKGFGALMLQYAVQVALLRFAASAISEVSKAASEGENGIPPAELLEEARRRQQEEHDRLQQRDSEGRFQQSQRDSDDLFQQRQRELDEQFQRRQRDLDERFRQHDYSDDRFRPRQFERDFETQHFQPNLLPSSSPRSTSTPSSSSTSTRRRLFQDEDQ